MTKRKTPKQIAADLEAAKLREANARAAARAAGRDPAAWGIDAAAMQLAQNADVGVVEQGKLKAVKRQDLFDRLHAERGIGTNALFAVQALEADLHTRALEGGKGDQVTGGGFGSRDLANCRSMAAGNRIDATAARMGWPRLALLIELLVPRNTMDEETARNQGLIRWRHVVEIMAGVRDDEAQRKVVIAACEALAEADRNISLGRAA